MTTGSFPWGRAVARPCAFTRLDPRTRLILLALLLVAIPMLRSTPWSLVVLASLGALAPSLLGVPRGFLGGLLRLAWLPLAFTVLANMLYGPRAGLLPHPSLEGLRSGCLHALAFWVTWLVFSLFWATTSPDELLRSLRGGASEVKNGGGNAGESGGSAARGAGESGGGGDHGIRVLPASAMLQDFWLTLELSVRFAPLLGEEAERLMLAQTARGETWGGGIVQRTRQAAGLLVPLVFSSLRRAEGLADTLVARGFGSARPTSAVRYRLGWRDAAALAGTGAALLLLARLP